MGNKNSKHKHGYRDHENNASSSESQNMKEKNQEPEEILNKEEPMEEVATENQATEEAAGNACKELEKKTEELQQQLDKEKKEYLFLMAEFDNFRKRTIKEKSEIIRNAGENVLKGLLPIMDDFERGIKAADSNPENGSIKEGIYLIYNKLKNYLSQNGVKEMDPEDNTFDTEKHEAISVVPVPDEDKKGKILDTVEKGYTINDKVLRHAKVVVGQ